MKILCKYSGIIYEAQYFKGTLDQKQCAHPIFSVKQSALLQYGRDWVSGDMNEVDSYLYFVALLQSTNLLEWRCAIKHTTLTSSIIAQSMEALIRTIGHLNVIQSTDFKATRIAITHETNDLSTVKQWIDCWEQNCKDFHASYKTQKLIDKLAIRERNLDKILASPEKASDPRTYAKSLAEWASVAAQFPDSLTLVAGKHIPLSDYWKSIIIKSLLSEELFSIDINDAIELQDHCIDYIEMGSVRSQKLFAALTKTTSKITTILGLNDYDLSNSVFKILPDSASVESANIQAMIDSAPTEVPVAANYPTKIAFLLAQARWRAAKAYAPSPLPSPLPLPLPSPPEDTTPTTV